MIPLLMLTGLLAFLPAQEVSDENIYTALEPGQYGVGVRIVHTEDRTRRIRVGVGNMRKSRPIQITIWYPAVHGEAPARMTYADYSGYKISEFMPDRQRSADRAAFVEQNKKAMLERVEGKADIENLFAAETRAVLNADPATGKFPLLLYAPSFNASPSENIVLCEYLASHGYVVAASPSAGPDSRSMTNGAEGIRAQADDQAFVMKWMEKSDQVDFSEVGTFGYSWGGMANVLFAIEHDAVKAVASLDGSITAPGYNDLIASFAELRPERQRAPLFFLASLHPGFDEDLHDYFFIEGAASVERYLLKIHGVGHGNFSSTYVAAMPYFSDKVRQGIDPENARAGYRATCFYLLKFFDAHLKGDSAAKEVFSQQPESNGFAKGAITLTRW